jgi:hypothetical protein
MAVTMALHVQPLFSTLFILWNAKSRKWWIHGHERTHGASIHQCLTGAGTLFLLPASLLLLLRLSLEDNDRRAIATGGSGSGSVIVIVIVRIRQIIV